jgi:hypothetical protein
MPIEIPARTRITIRIGIAGEEEPPLPEDFDSSPGLALAPVLVLFEPLALPPFECCSLAAVEPLPGLPWPAPLPLPVLGLPFADEDELPDDDPDASELEAPGLDDDELPPLAGLVEEEEPPVWVGVDAWPVTVGTDGLYWYPLESSA